MNEDDPNPQHHWPGQHWPPAQQLPPWWAFMPPTPVVSPQYEYQRGYQAGLQRGLAMPLTPGSETPSQGTGLGGASVVDPEIGKQITVAVVSGVLVAIAVSLVLGRKG